MGNRPVSMSEKEVEDLLIASIKAKGKHGDSGEYIR